MQLKQVQQTGTPLNFNDTMDKNEAISFLKQSGNFDSYTNNQEIFVNGQDTGFTGIDSMKAKDPDFDFINAHKFADGNKVFSITPDGKPVILAGGEKVPVDMKNFLVDKAGNMFSEINGEHRLVSGPQFDYIQKTVGQYNLEGLNNEAARLNKSLDTLGGAGKIFGNKNSQIGTFIDNTGATKLSIIDKNGKLLADLSDEKVSSKILKNLQRDGLSPEESKLFTDITNGFTSKASAYNQYASKVMNLA